MRIFNKVKKYSQHAGFSLVELSVVLAIIGVTLGGALSVATQKTEAAKLSQTREKLTLIEHSLEAYVALNQRLPCPADGTSIIDAATDNSYGVAGDPSSSGCTESNFNDGDNVYSGVVPVKTLGLNDETMIDGWGRRITYVVDYRAANNTITYPACNSSTNTGCFRYLSNGGLTIRDGAGGVKTNEAIYVLISHGKNGHGAFTYYGSSSRISFPSSVDNDEIDNSGNQTSYDAAFVQKSANNSFDDIVRYKPKWQLINDANGINDPHFCIPAKNVVDIPDVAGDPAENSCSNATNVTACEALAAKVHDLCWQ
jgi:prepilin-type N-terminal cleavage/methylation domain-containing protein